MNKTMNIKNLGERINKIENVLTAAACGDFKALLDVDMDDTDRLTSVETGINLMIEDMGEEVRESTERAEELEEKLKLIKQQQRAIEELSTPIIKIWDKVLVLPLIGTIDTRRTQKLTEAMLSNISATQSKIAIIDITGVPTVDSAVANHLLKTVAAVQLLGASCVITGIRPEVAQTIVHLGVDLGDVETLSNLAEGLQWALSRLDYHITMDEKA